MQISITARHFEVAPDLRQSATQRLEKLQKFATDIRTIHVVVSQERARYEAEITMRLNGGQLVCTETHADAGAAIDLAAHRLEEQLRRHKERKIASKQRPAGVPEAAADGVAGDGPGEQD
ncbi:MAG: ribosome-associated translation inhibitor RaiA [Candidatus Eisenbacteria bacterium]|nr:ribosome-associated translation inhibitor RaiA [Candidatus Eisenbacteria bacterium]